MDFSAARKSLISDVGIGSCFGRPFPCSVASNTGDGVFAGLVDALPGDPIRASRAALRRACLPGLKDPRGWEDDHMPPLRLGIPFSFLGRLPKVAAVGHGLSSSDEAAASEPGVARLIILR